jgi:UPF0755 protein
MQTKNTGDQEGTGEAVTEPHDGAETAAPPHLEIVWTSPVFTIAPEAPVPANVPAPPAPAPTRYVHAFESDFLDSHISWPGGDEPRAENATPVPGKKKPRTRASSRTATANVRLIDIYPEQPAPKPALQEQLSFPAEEAPPLHQPPPLPEVPAFTAHPFRPAIEQLIVDGRPTGMVFFETLAARPSLPKHVVYSTTEPLAEPAPQPLDEPADLTTEAPEAEAPAAVIAPVIPPPDLQAIIDRARPESAAVASAVKPFFDFPENVPVVPDEDTADTYRAAAHQPKTFGHKFLNFVSWCILVGFFFTVGVCLLYGRYAHKRLYEGETGSGRVIDLVVQPGETFRSVVEKMKKQGLLDSYMGVSDRYLMRYLAHLNENSNKLKPGAYRFNSNASLAEVYNRLIEGSKDFKITIPEGKTAQEVATEVKKRYPEFDDARFLELVKDPELIKKFGLDVPSLEGYLYPSTYFFGPGMKEEDLIRLMVNTFKQNVDNQVKPLGKHDELTFQQHLVMASLIEREARMDEDRPLIASVIFNRLAKDMPLQIDATVNYALNDWRRLTLEDLKVNSPYNTYTHKGLPPGPIASPRIASLVATFTAPQTDYLFYVYQGDGRHAFSATYEEFLGNKHKFQKAQADSSNFMNPSEETTKTAVAAGTPTAPPKKSRK